MEQESKTAQKMIFGSRFISRVVKTESPLLLRNQTETLATQASKPHDFEKMGSPSNAASDWRGAGSVDYLALEKSIKPSMLCFRKSQIWFHLICGRRLQMLWTDVYLIFESC